jgi:excisionase family DNA binding protein
VNAGPKPGAHVNQGHDGSAGSFQTPSNGPHDVDHATTQLAEAIADVLAAVASTAAPGHDAANGNADVAAYGREAAARYLGIGTTKLGQLTRDGRLPSVRIGDRRLWRRNDLDTFLAGLPSEAEG